MTNVKNALPDSVTGDLQKILDYLWDDEQADFLSQQPHDREGHVFEAVQNVASWLLRQTAATSSDEQC